MSPGNPNPKPDRSLTDLGRSIETVGARERRSVLSVPVELPEPELGLKEYCHIINKRRNTIALICLAVTALGLVYTHTSISMFRSDAVLEIGRDNMNSINNMSEALAQSLSGADNEGFATQSGILKSRTLAYGLTQRMNLAESDEFKNKPENVFSGVMATVIGAVGSVFAGEAAQMTDAVQNDLLVRSFLDRVTVRRESQSRLIRVSLECRDPAYGQEMLKNYIDLYVEQNLSKRRTASREATKWLKSELEKSELKLKKSMRDYVQFTNEHGIVSMDEGANHVLTFFNRAAEGLVKSKEQRVQVEAFQSDGLRELAALPPDKGNDESRMLKEKISALESEYNQQREIYSDNFPKTILLKKQIAFFKERLAAVEKHTVTAAVETARTQEQLQQETFEDAKRQAMENNSLAVTSAVIKKEVETNEEIFKLLLQKSKEMELNTQIIGNNVSIVDAPTLPLAPIRPKKAMNLLLSLAIGCVGGVLFAFAIERLDNSIHSSEDIDKKLGLVNLGVVPDIQKTKRLHKIIPKAGIEFTAYESPKSPVSEAAKNVKTSIFMSAPPNTLRTLVVTSSGPREGKTFTSVSLASVMCSPSKKVLLIDADLRRPRLGKVFRQSDNTPGLSTLLTRTDVKIQKVIHKSEIPGLYFMTAGPLPPNPAALLESERMEQLLARLNEVFEIVVFDSAPVVGFSDTRILAAMADGVVLVVKESFIPVELVKQAITMMTSVHARILGVVLNMAKAPTSHYGIRYSSYNRFYGYYSTNPERSKPLSGSEGA